MLKFRGFKLSFVLDVATLNHHITGPTDSIWVSKHSWAARVSEIENWFSEESEGVEVAEQEVWDKKVEYLGKHFSARVSCHGHD